MSKNKKNTNTKKIIDVTLASAMATGLFMGQAFPIANALDNKSMTKQKNIITGYRYEGMGAEDSETNGTKYYALIADLDAGYNVQCVETGLNLQYIDLDGAYIWEAEKNGSYHFVVKDSNNNIIGDTFTLEVKGINEHAIVLNARFDIMSSNDYASLSANLENYKNKKFEVTLEYSANADGSNLEKVDFPLLSSPDTAEGITSNYYAKDVYKNGYYFITVKNELNEIKKQTLNVTGIDASAPSLFVSSISEVSKYKEYSVNFHFEREAQTTQNVIVQLLNVKTNAVVNGAGYDNTNKFDGSLTVNENGTYKIIATYGSMGKTIETPTFEITEIDNDKPIVTFDYKDDGSAGYVLIKTNVQDANPYTIDIYSEGEKIEVDKDNSFIVEANGTYKVTVIDVAGNMTEETIVIRNISTIPADANVSTAFDNTLTNKNVSVELQYDSSKVNAVGITNKDGVSIPVNNNFVNIVENGTYYINFTYVPTNVQYRTSFVINNIDKEAPDVSFNLLDQGKDKTNQKVQIAVKEENLDSIKMIDAQNKEYMPDIDNIFTFTENGVYNLIVTDLVGHTTTKVIHISSIENNLPEKDISMELRYVAINGPFDVLVSVNDSDDYTIYLNDEKIEGNVFTIKQNGKYIVKVVDNKTGKYAQEEITIESFVEETDVINFIYDGNKTNKDVNVQLDIQNISKYDSIVATLDGEIIPIINNNVVVQKNGKLIVIATNTSENVQITNEMQVDFINKEPIDVEIDKGVIGDTYVASADLQFKFKDYNKIYQIYINGELISGYNHKILENGEYDIYIVDDYGNEKNTSVTYNTIVKNQISIKNIEYSTAKTNQDVPLNVEIEGNGFVLAILEDMKTGQQYVQGNLDTVVTNPNYEFLISQNGNYKLSVTTTGADGLEGNTEERLITIDNIRKDKIEINTQGLYDKEATDNFENIRFEEVIVKVSNPETYNPNEKYYIYLNGEQVGEQLIGAEYRLKINESALHVVDIRDEYGNDASVDVSVQSVNPNFSSFQRTKIENNETLGYSTIQYDIKGLLHYGQSEGINKKYTVMVYNKNTGNYLPLKNISYDTLFLSDESSPKFSEETLTINVRDNTTYLVQFYDESNGILHEEEIEIKDIKEKPDVLFKYSDTINDVSDVVLEVDVNTTQNYDLYINNEKQTNNKTYRFLKNGSYNVKILYESGIYADDTIEITNIDLSKIDLSYVATKKPTYNDINVLFNLIYNENYQELNPVITYIDKNNTETNINIEGFNDKHNGMFVANKNGTYKLKAGNFEKDIIINNIIEEKPVFDFKLPFIIPEYEKETTLEIHTNISELLPMEVYVADGLNPSDDEWNLTYDSGITETPDSIENTNSLVLKPNRKFKNGTYSFKFIINNELTLIKTFTVDVFNEIDVIVNYDDKKTNKDVNVKYTVNFDKDYSVSVLDENNEIINSENNLFVVSKNGTYKIVVSYNNGETFIKEVNISNINKEKPDVTLSYLTNITTKNIELGINVSNKENYTITVNGHDVIGNIYIIDSNGDYEVTVIDDYGNITTKTITIDNIVEKPLMVNTVIKNKDKTNQNVDIDLNIWSEENLSYNVVLINKSESIEKQLGQVNSISIEKNGNYTIKVIDADNNIVEDSFEISNINKETPILNVKHNVDLNKPTNLGVTSTFKVKNKDKYRISISDSKGNYLIPSHISSGSSIDEVVGGNGQYEVNGLFASIIYDFSNNDTYHVYIIDEYGNSYKEDIVINNIYLENPNVKLDVNLEKTVESLNVGITISNKKEFTYILKNIETGVEKAFTHNDKSFTITENGNYKVIVKDIANNETTVDLVVKNIDKEVPILDIKYDKSLTNKDIEATYTVQDASKTINNIYYFKEKPFENDLSFDDIIALVKDKKPLALNSAEIELENTITGKFMIQNSGYYLMVSEESLNHNIYKLIKVDNINKELPEFDLISDNRNWTSKNINVDINVKNKDKYHVFLQGREIENQFTVYQNGVYTITIKDEYGNKSEKSIEIKNIDKNAPVLNISYLTTPTNKDIIMNISAVDTGVGLKSLSVVGKNGNVYEIKDNRIIISENDTLIITAIDELGNKVEKEYIIKNIDKVTPTLDINYDNKTLTSKNVPVKFNIKDINDYSVYINNKKISGTTFYASKNGKYTVTVLDAAGNRIEKTFEISNIDKKGPSIKLSYDDNLTEKPIIVKYKVQDENGIRSVTVDGKPVKNGEFTISKNGNYTVRAIDKAGNVFAQTLNITNIDLLPPEIKDVKVYIKDLKTYLDIYAIDDASGVKSIKVNGIDVTKFKDSVRVFNDGLYIIEVTDNLNKITTEIFEVTGVRLKRIIPCDFKKVTEKEDNNPTGNTSDKNDDKKPNITESGKEKVEIQNNADKIVFGTSKYAINVKNADYKPTNEDLLEWYEVIAPEKYEIKFNILDIKFDVIGEYDIPVTINSPDGTVLNHSVTIIINETGQSTGAVIKGEVSKDDGGFLSSISSIFSADNLQLIGKIFAIGLGVVGLSAGGYYAFSEVKKRQEVNMVNVLIIINGKPFTVERIKRTMSILDLKKHLVEDVLSEYFKNTKERIKVKSIVPVDEEIFNVKEKTLAAQKGCSRIIYVTYEIKKDLR